jgi:hypothetical protein
LVFDEVAAATDARLPTPKSPDRCALYGALFDARVPAPALAAGPRADRDRARARFAYALLLAVLETSRCGGALAARVARAAAAGEALEDEDHEPAAPLRAAEEPSAFDAYGSVVTRARSEGAELQTAMAAPEAPPEVLLARALRRAVVEAGAVYGAADVDADAADAADLDFSAAWVALAGRGVESMTPGDCAALLRPFATHWGGAPGAALAARAPRGGGDPADDAAARKVAALLAAATNGVVDATSLSLFVDDTSTDAGGSTAANFSSFHAQAERPVHRALRRVPIRHVTPPPDPRLHLAPASKFALLTVAVVDGPRDGSEPHAPAAPQSYALSALVFPGRAASSTTLDAADLPATVDQDRLPAELVRRATFDDSDLLEPLKLPRAAAANGN